MGTEEAIILGIARSCQFLQVCYQQFIYLLNFTLEVLGLGKGFLAKECSKGLKSVKDIPGPSPLPIVGTTLTSPALKEPNLQKANEERLREYGPIVKEEHLWGFPLIHLLTAEGIEKAVKVIGQIRPGMEILIQYRKLRKDRYDSLGLTNEQGNEWERLHAIVNPVLKSSQQILSTASRIDTIGLDFVEYVRKKGPMIEDFQELSLKYVVECGFCSVFGTRMGFIQDEDQIPEEIRFFSQANDRLWSALHESSYGFPWWKYFPTKLWARNKEAEDQLLDLAENLINKSVKEGITHNGGMLGPILDSTEISFQTKTLLVQELILGASDSIKATLSFLLYWLSRDKRISRKLFEELRSIMPKKGSPMDPNELHKLPYLNACVMEGYRLGTIAPNFMRLSESPLEIEGYHIPPYSLLVLQWQFAALQDENFYKAKEFIPERWIYEGNVPPFQPHKRGLMYPYGYGKRACPGSRMAKHLILVFLARMFRNFEVDVEEPVEPKYVWIIQPSGPVRVTFKDIDED